MRRGKSRGGWDRKHESQAGFASRWASEENTLSENSLSKNKGLVQATFHQTSMQRAKSPYAQQLAGDSWEKEIAPPLAVQKAAGGSHLPSLFSRAPL